MNKFSHLRHTIAAPFECTWSAGALFPVSSNRALPAHKTPCLVAKRKNDSAIISSIGPALPSLL